MKLRLIAALPLAVVASVGHADRLTEAPMLAEPESLHDRLCGSLNLLTDEVGLHVNTLTKDLVDVRFDAFQRRAKLRIGGGNRDTFALHIDGNILFSAGRARIDATLDLSLLGNRLTFRVPEFDMVPRTWDGQQYLEFRVPVLQGSF